MTKLVAAWSAVNELFFNYCELLCLTSLWLQSTLQLSLTFFLEIITFTALLTVLEDCPFARRHADWLFWFYSLKAFCNKNVHPLTEFTVISCGTWAVHYNKHTHPWKKMLLNSSTDTQLLCPRYVTLTLHEGSILILRTVGELKEKISKSSKFAISFFLPQEKKTLLELWLGKLYNLFHHQNDWVFLKIQIIL